MGFFKLLSENMKEGQKMNMTILKKEDKLVASLIVDTTGVKDNAVKEIPPLVIRGTPEEFEESFADAFKPIAKTFSLVDEVQRYETSVEEARKKTDMEKKEEEKIVNAKKKFNEQLAIAKKLKDERKYKDAKAVLEKANEMGCADTKKVAALLAEVSRDSGERNLFGGSEHLSGGKYSEMDEEQEEDKSNETDGEE